MHTKHILAPFMALCLLGSLSGCGGGGGGDDTINLSAQVTSPTLTVDEAGQQYANQSVASGDFGDGLIQRWRGIWSFDISSIPAGASIQSATVRILQFQVNGNPYADLGNLLLDHINMGAAVVGNAFTDHTLASNIGTLSTSATLAYKTLDVTSRVQADVDAGRSLSQSFTRFTIDSNEDAVFDNAFFDGPQNNVGEPGNEATIGNHLHRVDPSRCEPVAASSAARLASTRRARRWASPAGAGMATLGAWRRTTTTRAVCSTGWRVARPRPLPNSFR